MIKKILNRAVWVLLFASVLFLLAFANIERNNSYTNELEVILQKTEYPALTSSDRIKTHILETMPNIIGQSVKNVDLESLEDEISLNTHLSNVRAFLNINGDMNIKAKPREAILRVFDIKGQNLYIGEDKILMDNSLTQSHRLIVASGSIPHLSNEERIQILKGEAFLPEIYVQLYQLAGKIHKDEFLDALIDQIHIDSKGQIELTPKVGVKKICFGSFEDTDEKLFNLKAFYVKGKDMVDWQKYQSINIKYKNQIVCSKK